MTTPSLPLPDQRLLVGTTDTGPLRLAEHHQVHGALPSEPVRRGGDAALIAELESSGLLGRGGAGFPAGRKARTVAAGRRPVLVANAADGEPASRKDTVLLMRAPHLVLDGMEVAVRAVGATAAHLVLHRDSEAGTAVAAALAERDTQKVHLHLLPPRYVSSEASAVVSFLNGGEAKPTFAPPQVYERGVKNRPTLVHNVETLAHLALIARHGSEWFRSVGDADEPGTLLLTLTTAARRSVVEVPTGTKVGAALETVGQRYEDTGSLLVGGYFGTWMTPGQAWHLPLTHYAMRAAGGGLGAGVVAALPADGVCGLVEAARIATYLARENAGQCGPCLNGLPALARAMTELATAGRRDPSLSRWLSIIPGRGACAHPDGATRMISSALTTFADEVERHVSRGACHDTESARILPVPTSTREEWR